MIVSNNKASLSQAAEIVAAGGVIAYRTDTFYGLGADPFNRAAVSKIRDLKRREQSEPILLLLSDLAEVDRFVEQSGKFKTIALRHWPAPLTLIGSSRPEVPTELTAGTNSLGVRLPDDAGVRELVRICGGALTATSANISGQPPARTAIEVEKYFPAGVDLIIDGGEVTATLPSTVLDVRGAEVKVVREGAVTLSQIQNRER
jgi:L-threonylcarbamoyladenylate synthase